MPWMIFAILLTLLDTLSSEVAGNHLADIYWNATNPIFRIDNTDHIIDVNKGNTRFEYDQVNIICPVYPHSNQGTKSEEDEEKESEQYTIYNVSKEEYDSCRITNPHPRIIAVCDKPHQTMYFTITFRSFTPQPGGLEFLPGHDYYFVSTSSGELSGLNQRVGGRCATHNMKVIFKVCCKPTKGTSGPTIPSSQTTATNFSVPASASPTVHSSSAKPAESKFHDRNVIKIPTTTAASTEVPLWNWMSFTVIPPYLRPYEVPIEDEMDRSPPVDKNKESKEKILDERERVKNEELVNSAPSSQSYRWYTCCSILLCTIHHLVMSLICR